MNSSALLATCEGLSYRQLDYACRQGWLKPDNPHGKGTNSGREWTNQEVRIVRLACRLMSVGFPLKRAIEIARAVPEKDPCVTTYYIYLGKGINLAIDQ